MNKQLSLKKRFTDKSSALVYLFLTVCTSVIYLQTVNFGFTGWDNSIYVYENVFINTGFSIDGILWAFKFHDKCNMFWAPMTFLSHMLDCELFGLNPGGHHVINLLIHLANSMLVFHIFRKMTGSVWPSAFTACLFAVHPINVESVAWIASRKNVLSTFFFLLTIRSYIHYVTNPSRYKYIAVLFILLLGLMTKPMLVTMPFLLLLLDFWPLGRIPSGLTGLFHRHNIRYILEKIPFLFLSIAFTMISTHFMSDASIETSSLGLRISNAVVSYALYIRKLIWPSDLAIFYPFPETIAFWKVAVSGIAFTIVTIMAFYCFKTTPWFSTGWFWYAGTLLPAMGIKQAGLWPAMADRFCYIPQLGLFMMISWFGADIAKKFNIERKWMLTIAVCILLPYMILSWRQAGYWKKDTTLFQRAAEISKNSAVILRSLGIAYGDTGEPEKAIKYLEHALSMDKSDAKIHFTLGLQYFRTGRTDDAIASYTSALRIEPKFNRAENNLGVAFMKKNKVIKAAECFKKAIELNPYNADAWNNLGYTMRYFNRPKEAIFCFKKALNLNPDFTTAQKNYNQAVEEITKNP